MLSDAQKQVIDQAAMQWLVKLESPDLTEDQEQAFMAWLDESPLHQAAYIKAEDIWQRGEALSKISPQNASSEEASAPPKPSSGQVIQGNFPLYKKVTYLAAAACVCAFMVLGFQFYSTSETFEAQYVTAVGEQRTITLPDGSQLLLNTDTDIAVKLVAHNRVVTLHRGEVFFEVSRDTQRPFDVMTSAGQVRVLGTKFSVFNNPGATTVTVLEGAVGLDGNVPATAPQQSKSEAAGGFSADVTLRANEQLTLEEAADKASPRKVDAQNQLEWRSQHVVFRGERLEEVVKSLNRYFTHQLRIADPELADLQVIAVVQVKDFNKALLTLEQSLNLRSERKDTSNEVYLFAK
ncbi:hypothetical protein TDB9533_02045 [Thalassocella blandensis]|nr:hypothetical protein TDB9533_02045 [Thalassocella blandensis]